jgi:hypothetical protein
MNAQEEWKEAWRNKDLLMFDRRERHEVVSFGWLDVIIRAALERKLAAAQREIERAVQAEREACAKVAEYTPLKFYDTSTSRAIAAAIRARGTEQRENTKGE